MNRNIEAALIALVTSEPELKTSPDGKPWTSFSACVGDALAQRQQARSTRGEKGRRWTEVVTTAIATPLRAGARVRVMGP